MEDIEQEEEIPISKNKSQEYTYPQASGSKFSSTSNIQQSGNNKDQTLDILYQLSSQISSIQNDTSSLTNRISSIESNPIYKIYIQYKESQWVVPINQI